MNLQPSPAAPVVASPTAAPMAVAREEIRLSVETLRFEGLGAADARRAGAAFERHLAGLLHQHGLPDARLGAERAELRLGQLAANPALLPERCGEELAEKIWRQLADDLPPDGRRP